MKSGTMPSIVAAAVLVAAPFPVVGQDTGQVFRPDGQWALDYGEDYCRLARNFTDGKETLALAWERIQPGPFFRMILVSDAIKPYRSADELGWHFTPTDPGRKTRYTRSRTADGKGYFNLGQVTLASLGGFPPGGPTNGASAPPPPANADAGEKAPANPAPPPYDRAKEQALAKAIDGFVIDNGVTSPVKVDTQNLEAPFGALQACADDLARTWGLDPARLKTQQAAALPEGGGTGWLPQGTIAFTDFAKLIDGSNQVRLLVGADGKPTSCQIHWPVLDKSTNDKICSTLMASARFTPAKDAEGQAMPGYFVTGPSFLLPPFGGRR